MFAFARSGDAMLYHPSLVSEALENRAWCDQRPNPELFILHLFCKISNLLWLAERRG